MSQLAASSSSHSSSKKWRWGQPTKYIQSSEHYYRMGRNVERRIRSSIFKWGFGDFSKLIFHSKYSRKKSNGSNESWQDVVIRCTNGSITLVKNHMMNKHLEFTLPTTSDIKVPNNTKDAEADFAKMMTNMYPSWDAIAEDMADNILHMKMLPPGRGLWGMGELAFKRGSMVLNNCGAASTNNLYKGATWTMGALMYGCGVGFDTEFKGPVIRPDKSDSVTYHISDDREGWVNSTGALIQAYVPTNSKVTRFPIFDYSKIRPKGAPIKTFGGTASGPEPLIKLHHRIEIFFDTYLDMQESTNDDTKLEIFHKLVDGLVSTDFSDRHDILNKFSTRIDSIVSQHSSVDDRDILINKLTRYLDELRLQRSDIIISDILNSGVTISEDMKSKVEATRDSLKRLFYRGETIDTKSIIEQQLIIVNSLIELNVDYFSSIAIGTIKQIEVYDKLIELLPNFINGVIEFVKSDNVSNLDSHIWEQERESKIVIPLRDYHQTMVENNVATIKDKIKSNLSRKTYDIVRLTVDIMNSIGACVVAGNVRRSSMLATGEPDDDTFLLLKDYTVNPERTKIGAMSNNSVKFVRTEQYTKYLPKCAHQTALNGEPGYLFLLNVQEYGRVRPHRQTNDSITRETEHDKAHIPNPCSEIALVDEELCCVVEIPMNRHLKLDSKGNYVFDYESFHKACILALIYAKSVSVFPTNEPTTNAVISRNHRLGISTTGNAQVHDLVGMTEYIAILRSGYKIIRQADRWLSNILGVRESLRVTTNKPSGTVALLSGSTSGIHFSHSRYIIRRVRLASTSKLVPFLVANGYTYENDKYADNTVVFEFVLDYGPVRSVQNITMDYQLNLLRMYQSEWADNMVSVTVTFNPETEAQHLEFSLPLIAPLIKSVSFLPNYKGVYDQMPLEEIDKATYKERCRPIDWSLLRDLDESSIPQGCTNDTCTIGDSL